MEKKRYIAPLVSIYVMDAEEVMDAHVPSGSGEHQVDVQDPDGSVDDSWGFDNTPTTDWDDGTEVL